MSPISNDPTTTARRLPAQPFAARIRRRAGSLPHGYPTILACTAGFAVTIAAAPAITTVVTRELPRVLGSLTSLVIPNHLVAVVDPEHPFGSSHEVLARDADGSPVTLRLAGLFAGDVAGSTGVSRAAASGGQPGGRPGSGGVAGGIVTGQASHSGGQPDPTSMPWWTPNPTDSHVSTSRDGGGRHSDGATRTPQPTSSTYSGSRHHDGDHATPTPTPTPSPYSGSRHHDGDHATPTPTPTPRDADPTRRPQPTPTPSPTRTPTPTPTPTPSPTPEPHPGD